MAELTEAEKAKALEEEKKAREEMLEQLRKAKSIEEQLLDLREKTNFEFNKQRDFTESYAEQLKKINALEQEQIKNASKRLQDLLLAEDVGAKILSNDEEAKKVREALRELGYDQLDTLDDIGKALENHEDVIARIQKKEQEKLEIAEKHNRQLELAENLNSKIASSMGITAKASESASFKAMEFAQGLAEGNMSMVGLLRDSLGVTNVFHNLVDQAFKIALGLDNASKAFGSMTGFGDTMALEFESVYKATVESGGSIEDAQKAMGALANNFSAFDPAAKSVNEKLATNLVLLQKIGVDNVAAAKSMDFFTRSLNMSAPAAADVTREIAMMGQEMGVTASKMMSDFQAVSGDLAIYGNRMTEVFKGMAAAAKASGLEMSTLVQLGKQFDTFDGAADATSKLNSVLGTNLSTIDMMNMSYDERVRALQRELRQVGMNINTLDPYTQQYVAQSLGLSSVAEMQKLVNMSQADIDNNRAAQEAANKRQEDLAALTQQLVPIMDQLKIAFAAAAVSLEPLISHAIGFIQLVSDLSFLLKPLIVLMATIKAFTILYSGALAAQNAIVVISTTIQNAKNIATQSGISAEATYTAMKKGGVIATMVAVAANALMATGLFTVGKAVIFATAGLSLLIPLIIALIYYVTKPNSPPLYLIFGVIATAILVFAGAILGAMPVIAGLVGVLIALGLTMSLMFYTMNSVIESVTTLLNVFAEVGNTISGVADSISGAIVYVIDSVAGLFDKIVEAKDALPDMATNFTTAAVSFVSNVPSIVSGIRQITAAVGIMGFATLATVAAMGMLAAATTGVGSIIFGVGLIAGLGGLVMLADLLERIGTNMKAFGEGLQTITSIASQVSGDGFMAITTEGDKASMVVGSGDIMKNFVDGKITVDVNIPEIQMPKTEVHVYIDGKEIDARIHKVVSRR